MPGPIPDPNRQRRNAPLLPTVDLPAAGRVGPPPAVPDGYVLGEHGSRWWAWAWSTPQAAAWDDGNLYVVARRAQLEDDLLVLRSLDDNAARWDLSAVRQIVKFCKLVAEAEPKIKREMLDLDDRLGFTPKSRLAMRWRIVATIAEDEPDAGPQDEVARRRAERQARRAATGP